MNTSRRITAAILALAVHSSFALRVEMIGNSLTDHVDYDGFTALATAAGYTHVWARQMIPGASIRWNYEHPKEGYANEFGAPYFALRDNAWDAMSLQPTSGMGEDTLYARLFVEMALERSPFVQVYMYSQNPYQDDRPAGAQLNAAGFEATMNKTTTGELSAHGSPLAYWEAIPVQMRRLRNIKPVLTIPVGQVLMEFNRRASLGQVPGYTSAWGLYADDAHLNNVGHYLVGLTFFATIYKHDPHSSGVPSQYGSVPSAVAEQIRQCVWAVVSTHPLSGVKQSLEIIAHDTLPQAYDRVEYATGFGATRPGVTFTLASGSLPPGITLDGATGMLRGKPTQQGTFTFTLSADDQDAGTPGATVTRTITVGPAPAPQILTRALDSVYVRSTYRMRLRGAYACDSFAWGATGLPQGLTIDPSTGVISGIPQAVTRASVTVTATDAQSRTASRTMTLAVLAPPLKGLYYEYHDRDTFHSVTSYRNVPVDKIGITTGGISDEFRETSTGFAFKLSGWIRITQAGRHTFRNGADYGTIMTVAGRAIPNNGPDDKIYAERSDTITLQPGFYRFSYEAYQREGAWYNPTWRQPGSASFEYMEADLFYCDSAGVTGAGAQAATARAVPAAKPGPALVYDLAGRRLAAAAKDRTPGARITVRRHATRRELPALGGRAVSE